MTENKRKDVYPIGKKNPNLPFHPAVRAGDFIFISGQVAKDASGNMISGTIEVETAGTIDSIKRILSGRRGHPRRRGSGDDLSVEHVTSGVTTRSSPSTSRMQCLPARLSKRAPSSIQRSKWTPSRTNQAENEPKGEKPRNPQCRRPKGWRISRLHTLRRAD